MEKEGPKTEIGKDNSSESNTNEKDNTEKEDQCAICLENFKNGDKIKRLPCMHSFHSNEIDSWIQKNENPVCPLCRRNIKQFLGQ